jgi:ABC-2 type transport system permease protein
MRVLNIALKDLYQFVKKWQTVVFMLIMPPIFIIMFGGMFTGENTQNPVVLVSGKENSNVGRVLVDALEMDSSVDVQIVNMDMNAFHVEIENTNASAGLFLERELDTAVFQSNDWTAIHWLSGEDVWQELNAKMAFDRILKKVNAAAQFARADAGSLADFQMAFENHYRQLTSQPVQVDIIQTGAAVNPYAHPAPGMMLQFAIAGLTGVALILVMEKKGLTEARLRMSAVPSWQVMLGHYLAICMLLGIQFFLLLAFGQLVLGLDYLGSWISTSLLSLATILCVAALGLLIGVVSKSEDETTVFAMLAMFILSGLGGLWMPLEITGKTFQTIGHLTPLAWAMDGYQNILRGAYSFSSISASLLVLSAYTVGLLILTITVYQHQKSRTR